MGYNNPGRYRKEGREAFCIDEIPEDSCPYSNEIWSHKDDWLEGWEQGRKEYEAVSLEEKQYAIDNWEYDTIREKIMGLSADPALVDILNDIVDLIEEDK